ncbi:hypothetical protein C5167_040504 [Papaver somniferum]|uniref:Knottin scorpion toxin-like domain-containing protein n=1 Tax=Papaver somniferum TaxID=3469 RepID=A0A4Y7IIJ2_PAPSO|nr:hypothetical protein C5167_040504 [Papaver somniferum]
MAKNKTLILCFLLVLLIFSAGCKAKKQANKRCEETWVTSCITEEDCQDKCFRDHGDGATPSCLDRIEQGLRDLCHCTYDC